MKDLGLGMRNMELGIQDLEYGIRNERCWNGNVECGISDLGIEC